VLAGPDDGQEKELRSLADRLKIGDRVTFSGYLDRKATLEALVDASVVVIPSRSEVFAITAVEALMCGRPVVLSSACGLDPLPGTEHGLLMFNAEQIDDLTAKLSTVLSDQIFESRGALGKAFARREFGSEKIAKQAEDIYSDVLQHANRISQ
jgi:glycosyltransferase involved in cell wall biosynthesis